MNIGVVRGGDPYVRLNEEVWAVVEPPLGERLVTAEYFSSEPTILPWRRCLVTGFGSGRDVAPAPTLPRVASRAWRCTAFSTTSRARSSFWQVCVVSPPTENSDSGSSLAAAHTRRSSALWCATEPPGLSVVWPRFAQSCARCSDDPKKLSAESIRGGFGVILLAHR